MTKTKRLIDLMMVVYEKRRFTAEQLAEEFGVSYRTMLRYLQELSGMGVPLYSEPGRHGGYSLLNRSKASPIGADRPLPPTRTLFKPSLRLIGVEFKAPFTAVYMANTVIPGLWAELRERLGEIEGAVRPTRLVGAVRSRSVAYHYVAGAEVSSFGRIPDGMTGLTIPARAYAVYAHQGLYRREERDQTYFHALERLRRQGLDHETEAYGLEVLAPRTPGKDDQEYEIYIPLK
ncbi:HTH domain-containing protein [Cohnella hongkongensis]|uniref:HTH domain-containing protein n=1 Tax=Cohnella hongkongensis TaxID=178337 RepID=A0ABV9FBZ3_9BACL